MVKFINRLTGGIMYVHESRVDEYRAAGHRPAAELEIEKPKEKPAEKPAEKPKAKPKDKSKKK